MNPIDELTNAAEDVIYLALHPNRPDILKAKDLGKVSRLRRAIASVAEHCTNPIHNPAPWAPRSTKVSNGPTFQKTS